MVDLSQGRLKRAIVSCALMTDDIGKKKQRMGGKTNKKKDGAMPPMTKRNTKHERRFAELGQWLTNKENTGNFKDDNHLCPDGMRHLKENNK